MSAYFSCSLKSYKGVKFGL